MHDGAPAATAEALMRSRYSAYALGLVDYLRTSWSADSCPADLAIDASIRWLGLTVLAHRQLDPAHAEVEFVARFRSGGGPAGRLHERSRFERVGDHWRYVDGDAL